jgi:hypothetical protein
MTPGPLSKIIDEKRLGYVEEHGSRDRPVKKGRRK